MARYLGIVLLVAAAVPVCAQAAVGDPRHPAVARPAVLVWGDGLFASRDAFSRWLGTRGQSYQEWAAAHPVGREILTRAPTAPFTHSQLVPARAIAPVLPLPTTSGSGSGFPVLALLAAAGALLLTVGLVPLDRVARPSTAVVLLHERRVDVVAGGLAILVGVAVAKLAT